MSDAEAGGTPPSRPWLLFFAAVLAGFFAAGSFAVSVIGLTIFLVSVFAAVFLATLAHGVFIERQESPSPPEEKAQSPVGFPSL